MNRTTRQRLFTAAFLLALCALLIAAGVALALAEGSHLPAAITVSVLTLAFFVLLLRTDVARLIGILRAFQLVGPILAFTLTSALMGKTAGTLHFDEVGAQVLIVLLLALALDARFFRLRPGRDRLDVIVILYTMLLLAVGEFYALKGLLTDEPLRAEMIAGAIAAGFTAVAITALTGGGRAGADELPKDAPSENESSRAK